MFVSLYDDGAVPPFTVALLSLGALLLLDPPPSSVLADGGGGPQPLPSRGLRGSAKGGPPSFFLFLCFSFILCIRSIELVVNRGGCLNPTRHIILPVWALGKGVTQGLPRRLS